MIKKTLHRALIVEQRERYVDSDFYLTAKEKDMLHFLSEGKNLDQTADALNIGLRTLRFHRESVLDKFRCRTLYQALFRFALSQSWSDEMKK